MSVCRYFWNSVCLYVVVVCILTTARGLEYLPKARYIDRFSGQVGNTALCLKTISQKWATFKFGSTYLNQTSTKCMSNQYIHFDISTYQMWLQVMECLLILFRFLSIFKPYYLPFMSELFYLHQSFTNYVSNQ